MKIYLIQMLIDNCAWQTERAYDSREKAEKYLIKYKKYFEKYYMKIEEMILR